MMGGVLSRSRIMLFLLAATSVGSAATAAGAQAGVPTLDGTTVSADVYAVTTDCDATGSGPVNFSASGRASGGSYTGNASAYGDGVVAPPASGRGWVSVEVLLFTPGAEVTALFQRPVGSQTGTLDGSCSIGSDGVSGELAATGVPYTAVIFTADGEFVDEGVVSASASWLQGAANGDSGAVAATFDSSLSKATPRPQPPAPTRAPSLVAPGPSPAVPAPRVEVPAATAAAPAMRRRSAVSARAVLSRRRGRPSRIVVTGRVRPRESAAPAVCAAGGRVRIALKRQGLIVTTRTVRTRRDCTFRAVFSAAGRRGRLSAQVSFLGDAGLAPATRSVAVVRRGRR